MFKHAGYIFASLVSTLVFSNVSNAESAKKVNEDYINGFLDGAIVTDEIVVGVLEERTTKRSSFEERALRTRLDRRRTEKLPATFYADFCIPEGLSRNEAVSKISNELLKNEKLLPKPQEVYVAVKSLFPCDNNTKGKS